MILIVRRDTADKMPFGITAIAEPLCQRCLRNRTDDISQTFVFLHEQRDIFLPFPVIRWSDEPVGAFYRESLSLTRQASPGNVFPISGVDRKFPDIVPLFGGSPRSLRIRQSPQRAEQRRTMPRRTEERFIK